jgi:hypothetical protein
LHGAAPTGAAAKEKPPGIFVLGGFLVWSGDSQIRGLRLYL